MSNIMELFCFIFILLSRESDGGAILLSIPHSLRSCQSGCFFDFFPVNLLLVRSHQAEIIIVKHLIQGRSNATRRG